MWVTVLIAGISGTLETSAIIHYIGGGVSLDHNTRRMLVNSGEGEVATVF